MLSAAQEERLARVGAGHLNRAISFSNNRLSEVSRSVKEALQAEGNPEGLGYVVSGSLGRLETLEASDVDLIALCDVGAEIERVMHADAHVREHVRRCLGLDVSRGENFTGPTFLRDIVDQSRIGGSADHVNLLTKRMILLTEARSVSDSELYSRFVIGILDAFTKSAATRRRHFASLGDEVVRYYRTLAVDYKSRVDAERKSWAVRYLKLRHSRKYWFFSLALGTVKILSQFEAYPELAHDSLRPMFESTPTERIVNALEAAGMPDALSVVAFYGEFLDRFSDVETRRGLEQLAHFIHDGSFSRLTSVA